MRRNLLALFVVGLISVACTNEVEKPTPAQATSPAKSPTAPDDSGIEVPDVIGVDLVKAIAKLEDAGLEVDVSALQRTVRGYATGYQTHPRVQVTEMDPPPGTEVSEGATIAILDAECPSRKSGNVC